MKRCRRTVIAGLIALLFAFAACKRESTDPPPAPAPDAIPQRIISHAPAFTEIAFELGIGEKIVAVSDFCVYPPEVTKLPKVGGLLNPNLERAVSMRPDLVFVETGARELAERYRKLGIPVLFMRVDVLADIIDAVEKIATAAGVPERGAVLTATIRAGLDAVREKTAGRDHPRTLFVVEHVPGDLREIYVVGPKSFHGELLAIAGGENVFASLDRKYANVSAESILARDPEVVIVMSRKQDVTEEDVAGERAIWAKLPTLAAVKSGRVYLLPASPISAPTPRVVDSANLLARILHPAAFEPRD
ncbi:helical backbone metal receptor [bacterium]|nr:helical backbone metal receptor [bacterium]